MFQALLDDRLQFAAKQGLFWINRLLGVNQGADSLARIAFLVFGHAFQGIDGMAMSAPPMIVGLIGGDAQQPGTKRWPTAKHLDRAKGSKKGFLRDISSDFAVAEYAQDNIIHSLLIMQHQLIEGGDVSVLAARNEQGLIFSRRLCHCAASLFLQFAQVYHSCEYPEKPPVSSWGA